MLAVEPRRKRVGRSGSVGSRGMEKDGRCEWVCVLADVVDEADGCRCRLPAGEA